MTPVCPSEQKEQAGDIIGKESVNNAAGRRRRRWRGASADPAHHDHQEYSAGCAVVIPDQWVTGSHVTVGSVTDELQSCVTAEKHRHHHQLTEIMAVVLLVLLTVMLL